MSKVKSIEQVLLNSQLGDVLVTTQTLTEFDVEDVIRNRAISQARTVQFINVGKQISANAVLPDDAIPSAFKNNEIDL